jgi:hypothetical protein
MLILHIYRWAFYVVTLGTPMTRRIVYVFCVFLLLATAGLAQTPRPQLLEVRKIWDAGGHNAFTDLVHFRGHWFCVFREGKSHVSPDGSLRVITSTDGAQWRSAALITSAEADLRDPKLTVNPDPRLMLSAAAARHQPAGVAFHTQVWTSADGAVWSQPREIGEADFWLWRITWFRKMAYAVGYSTAGQPSIRLYQSRDGVQFDSLVKNLYDQGEPNETSLLLAKDSAALCLLRRDAANALLGASRPPYRDWAWKDLGKKLGGPHMLGLPDGRIVAAGRLHDGKVRTGLCWLDPEAGTLTEFLTLPSGGDTSYPGLVFSKGVLWVSYYSSHEGKTSIYLAKVRL